MVKNNSKMNRIWEYPEEKDIIPLSNELWKMEEGRLEEESIDLDIDMNGNIENSDLLTHKSRITDLSKKESDKSSVKAKIEKEKGFSKITEKQAKGFEFSNSESEHIQKIVPSKVICLI
jgi:hypothetical protein